MEEFVIGESCLFRRLEACGTFVPRGQTDQTRGRACVHVSEVLVKLVLENERSLGTQTVVVGHLQGGAIRKKPYAPNTRVWRVRLHTEDEGNSD